MKVVNWDHHNLLNHFWGVNWKIICPFWIFWGIRPWYLTQHPVTIGFHGRIIIASWQHHLGTFHLPGQVRMPLAMWGALQATHHQGRVEAHRRPEGTKGRALHSEVCTETEAEARDWNSRIIGICRLEGVQKALDLRKHLLPAVSISNAVE